MKARWISGNRVSLLENGEAFFPRVFECIAAAQREVLLETFILFEDKVGRALHAALLSAARRGVRIDITVDGYGSPDLSPGFVGSLARAGVHIHVFDPAPRLWGMRTNVFRRMHRKIVAIDAERAFVGGINYSADHLADFGPRAKQDYAVEIEGPLAQHIRGFAVRTLRASRPGAAISGARNALSAFSTPSGSAFADDLLDRYPALTDLPREVGDMAAMLVVRDNRHHRNDIEHHYRIAIRTARERVLIANAYFFPGYRLLRDMRRAARRGVNVQLILQGAPDMPIVKTAANLLYHHLLTGGVRIYEYTDRPLHGKVATSDGEWATVGSSNLDPLSLSLNLEANVIVRDRAFNAHLQERLDHLIEHSCRQVAAGDLAESNWWRVVRSFFVFHLLRRYPAWAGWLPAHAPQLTPAEKLVKADTEPVTEPDAS
jgi:cardiolipin synthase